jgi:hypothetical protein
LETVEALEEEEEEEEDDILYHSARRERAISNGNYDQHILL